MTLLLILGVAFGASPERVFPYDVQSTTLENGLQVHVVPMNAPGVVSVYTWMRVGSRDELDVGRTGFAHFFEHLMFHGTPTLTGDARKRELVRLGAEENAWTWTDETVYHATFASSGLKHFIDMEADRFQNLSLTPAGVQREAGAVYGEWRKSKASPGQRLSEALHATAFNTHTYKHSTIGYEADIQAMPDAHEYAMAFFKTHYRPNNAHILVVGDVEPASVVGMVKEAYGGWAPQTEERRTPPAEPKQTSLRTVHVDWKQPTAARLVLAWKIPGADPADPVTAQLQLVQDVLLSDVGPLRRRLVEEDSIAYSVRGGRSDLVDEHLFTISIRLKDPEHIARAEAIVREELQSLADAPDADALNTARAHSRYAFLTALDEPDRVASSLGWAMRRGGTADSIDTFYSQYDSVQPAHVAKTVAEIFVDSGLTRATLTHTPDASKTVEESP